MVAEPDEFGPPSVGESALEKSGGGCGLWKSGDRGLEKSSGCGNDRALEKSGD